MYEIEKGVPIPPQAKGIRKYPLPNMEPGDSFAVSMKDKGSFHSSIQKWKERHPEQKWTSRTQPDGSLRVWRIE